MEQPGLALNFDETPACLREQLGEVLHAVEVEIDAGRGLKRVARAVGGPLGAAAQTVVDEFR